MQKKKFLTVEPYICRGPNPVRTNELVKWTFWTVGWNAQGTAIWPFFATLQRFYTRRKPPRRPHAKKKNT
jgi:hypothetical protein